MNFNSELSIVEITPKEIIRDPDALQEFLEGPFMDALSQTNILTVSKDAVEWSRFRMKLALESPAPNDINGAASHTHWNKVILGSPENNSGKTFSCSAEQYLEGLKHCMRFVPDWEQYFLQNWGGPRFRTDCLNETGMFINPHKIDTKRFNDISNTVTNFICGDPETPKEFQFHMHKVLQANTNGYWVDWSKTALCGVREETIHGRSLLDGNTRTKKSSLQGFTSWLQKHRNQ